MVDEPSTESPAQSSELDDVQSEPAVVQDLLVEEVSIDGMCGVY